MLKDESVSSISENEIRPNKPEPITSNIDVVLYKRRIDPQDAIDALVDGYHVLIHDFYSSGLTVLHELKRYIQKIQDDQSFQGQRNFRSKFQELSNRIVLKINNHNLVVRKAPEIGWLKILYPELNEYLLSFPQVQGLNSSWQWYKKGIFIPVLKRKIHPWFGTYFPTRFEHLELFDKWLRKYNGELESAMDIGIGNGVLSFQMLKAGFEKIYGSDTNPNAIIGLTEDLKKNKLSSKINLLHGDLFANSEVKTELIVFNPPWVPTSHPSDGLDNAIYYNKDLFPRFFAEATKHLKPNGKVVILFSNLAQVTNVSKINPIEEELTSGGRFQKELLLQKDVRLASKKTKRNQNWRAAEMVELWVLSRT